MTILKLPAALPPAALPLPAVAPAWPPPVGASFPQPVRTSARNEQNANGKHGPRRMMSAPGVKRSDRERASIPATRKTRQLSALMHVAVEQVSNLLVCLSDFDERAAPSLPSLPPSPREQRNPHPSLPPFARGGWGGRSAGPVLTGLVLRISPFMITYAKTAGIVRR